MKPLLKIAILLIPFAILLVTKNRNSYKMDYRLDYAISYINAPEENYNTTSYINSMDNSFFTMFITNAEKSVRLDFLDDKNGIYAMGDVTSLDLEKIEQDGIVLSHSFEYKNVNKYQINNYDFFRLSDTVVDNTVCKRVLLRSTKPNRERKQNILRAIYVIDTTQSIKPHLEFSTAYEILKARKNFPDGLILEQQFYRYNTLKYTKKLKSFKKVDFTLRLKEE